MTRLMQISSSVRGVHTIVKNKPGHLVWPQSVSLNSRLVLRTSSLYYHKLYTQTSGHDVCFTGKKITRPSLFHQYRQYSSESEKKSNVSIPIVAAVIGAVGVIGAIVYTRSKDDKGEHLTPSQGRKKTQVLDDDAKAAGPTKLPEQVKYLIVGAGTAAMSATKAIRTNDPTAKVLMVTEEGYRPYMRPPLSKGLWFKGADADKLSFNDWAGNKKDVFYQPREFFLKPEKLNEMENGGVAIGYKKKVTKIDVVEQKAKFQDGSTVKYEKCLIATGGTPKNLPVFEKLNQEGLDKVHLFRNIADFFDLYHATDKAKSVMVVGGGFLGSELAVALAAKAKESNMKVIQTFPEEGNMGRVFPKYLSKWTLDKVRKEGVEVHPGTIVTDCSYNKSTKKLDLVMNTGDKFTVDEVVVAVGLEPSVELGPPSGLEVDSHLGGFLVNAELEARKNLWVAGDAACFYDITLGRRRVEHHDHAVVSGRLAGENMTGEGKPYWHQSMFWSDLGPEVGYEAIGICDSALPTFAVFAKGSEADTPKAVVKATGEEMRSETERTSSQAIGSPDELHAPIEGEDYGKGVIFYTDKDRIVGIVLWNLFGRMPIARQVLKEGKVGEDLTKVARLFEVHSQKLPQESNTEENKK